MDAPAQDGVVLLHGIFRTARSMGRLERFFMREGFATLNLGYPSTRQSLAQIVEAVAPQVAEFSARVNQVHFVGHSMGGLVIRALLAKYRPTNLGRVVMLGTPNQGSEVADFLQRWWLYRKLFGPAGQELTTLHAPLLAGSQADYPLGVIAGTMRGDPLCHSLLGGPNDGKVSVERTKLAGMTEHRALWVGHVFFPLNRSVRNHTLGFLRTGRFPTL